MLDTMLVLAVVMSALAVAQDPPPAAAFSVDGRELASPRAVVSPLGWLEVTGRSPEGEAGGAVTLVKLRFPPLDWPAAGAQAVPAAGLQAHVGTPASEGDSVAGKLDVKEIGPTRVHFTFDFARGGSDHTASVDLPAELYVPKLQPTAQAFTPPRDEPQIEDVVLCVLGNGGTGLPGQRQVAASMAALAPTGPLDCVILLGNNFMPRGVASERDPLFQSRFEQVYDPRRLAVPFYVVQGPAEHLGDISAATKYGILNARWTAPAHGFDVVLPCHGKTVGLYGCDSEFQSGDIADIRVRSAIRMLVHYAMTSKADWKIVFTHHQLLSLGGQREGDKTKLLSQRLKKHLDDGKFDLLVCAEGGGMRFVQPENGIPQVMAGGGGGPEMAAVVEQVPGTEFAYGGGGTVWLRCSGSRLVISFRDADGKLLYARELTKS